MVPCVAYTSDYPFVYLTVDVAVLTVLDGELSVLTVRRGSPPFEGRWALPGGFVDPDEDLERAARRELREETGVGSRSLRLHQLRAYGDPKRDPRHRVVSVAHLAVLPPGAATTAGDDATHAQWRPVPRMLRSRLAFDHRRILSDAVERLATEMESTNIAMSMLPDEFTISELRAVYEAAWGISLDPGNFQRKVTGVEGFVVETGRQTSGGRGRPAGLYRAGPTSVLRPPMSRNP
jgi:8-oxo-dGTP diphosphatase